MTDSPEPVGVRRHRALAVGSGLVAASAIAGAIGLASGGMSMGPDIDARLPFASTVLGGAALVVVVGCPFTLLAAAAWSGDRRTASLSIAAGSILVIWLLVELAFIREVSFLHPVLGLTGLAFVLIGRRGVRSVAADERSISSRRRGRPPWRSPWRAGPPATGRSTTRR